MTTEQLHAAIAANAEAKALADAGNDAGAAKVLTAALPALSQPRDLTISDLFAVMLAAKLITQAQIDAVNKTTQVAQTVTPDQVSAAWLRYRPEGKVARSGK